MATRIKTFEAACKLLKLDQKKTIPDVSVFPKEHHAALIAHAKLIIIAQALNGGWKPNWNDHNQWKYYPWFKVNADAKRPSGFGLSYLDFGLWGADSAVGSRLCFETSDLAEYAGKQFKDLYEDYFLMK